MNIRFDYCNMMKDVVGSEGIDHKCFSDYAKEIAAARRTVSESLGRGWYGWSELPFKDEKEISKVIAHGEAIRKSFENFVLFGIGGSALGPLSVAAALLHPRHNELPSSKRNAPKLYVEDNVDPERMASLLDILDLKTTHFNFVTKSGETSETLSQFLVIYKLLKDSFGAEQARQHVTITTTLGKGSLYEIARSEGLTVFDIESGVGGRFSVLSNVGLVTFAVMGFDIKKLLLGAGQMTKACLESDVEKNPALLLSLLQTISMKQGKNISVMMPYADSLKYMADFYAQLWGESLGKERDNDGKIVRCGQTPVKALGVTDQHSQIQLYVEGPHDKVITIIKVERYRNEVLIPRIDGIERGEFLSGNTMNKLISSECEATTFALTKAGCPNYSIILSEVNENTLGQLLAFFMYQTAYAGALLNIDAFNQPGVEEGKKATFAMLGRKGYEQKLEEIISKKNNKYKI